MSNDQIDNASDEEKARTAEAMRMFEEYFVRNYPGPNTVISNPYWHAPKIFRAALYAIKMAESKKASQS